MPDDPEHAELKCASIERIHGRLHRVKMHTTEGVYRELEFTTISRDTMRLLAVGVYYHMDLIPVAKPASALRAKLLGAEPATG